MVEKIFVFLVSPFFIAVSILYYANFKKRKREPDKPAAPVAKPVVINKQQAEIKPPPQFEALNRHQRRRMDKAEKAFAKKYAGKKLRDELRSGKIVEANEFLKKYFNDNKE